MLRKLKNYYAEDPFMELKFKTSSSCAIWTLLLLLNVVATPQLHPNASAGECCIALQKPVCCSSAFMICSISRMVGFVMGHPRFLVGHSIQSCIKIKPGKFGNKKCLAKLRLAIFEGLSTLVEVGFYNEVTRISNANNRSVNEWIHWLGKNRASPSSSTTW